MDKNKDNKDIKISLEDLLKLKRNEKPTADFWSRFDQSLHQRKLSILFKKQPAYKLALKFLGAKIYRWTHTATLAAATLVVFFKMHQTQTPLNLFKVAQTSISTLAPAEDYETFAAHLSANTQKNFIQNTLAADTNSTAHKLFPTKNYRIQRSGIAYNSGTLVSSVNRSSSYKSGIVY
jgi:hypothetical protein